MKLERMDNNVLAERVEQAIDECLDGWVLKPLGRQLEDGGVGVNGHILAALGLDDLGAAVERAGAALSSFRLTATPDAIEEPWSRRMAAVVLEAALTATEGTDVVPNRDDPASSGGTKGHGADS